MCECVRAHIHPSQDPARRDKHMLLELLWLCLGKCKLKKLTTDNMYLLKELSFNCLENEVTSVFKYIRKFPFSQKY